MLYQDKHGNMKDTKDLSWWGKDMYGYPIEIIRGKPVLNCLRYVCINLVKISHLITFGVFK